MHWLVPKGHVLSALPAELGAAPTDVLMLVQLLPRQQQLTEQTGLQTLGTMVRLGEMFYKINVYFFKLNCFFILMLYFMFRTNLVVHQVTTLHLFVAL